MDEECTIVPEFNVHHCCLQHDYDYADQIGRWKADWRMLECGCRVNKTVAITYFIGVKLFGWWPYYKYTIQIKGWI